MNNEKISNKLNSMSRQSFIISDFIKNNYKVCDSCEINTEINLTVKNQEINVLPLVLPAIFKSIKIFTLKSYLIIYNIERDLFDVKLVGDIRNINDFTWNIIDFKCSEIAANILNDIEEEKLNKDDVVIVGIERGGLVPMTMISHKTGISTSVIKCQTRDNASNKIFINREELVDKILYVVDDVIETGTTKDIITEKTKIAKDVRFKFLHDLTEDNFNTWIVFPWEV